MAILSLQQVTVGYGGEPVLKDVCLQIDKGDRLCLVGRNGSGKSTLLQVIAGELPLESGERATQQGIRIARLIQQVPRDMHGSVFGVVAEGLGKAGKTLSQYHSLHDTGDLEDPEVMERLAKWQHILDHISGFTVFEKDGKRIFRLTEKGMAWCRIGTVSIWPIYPGNVIGLNSHPKLLELSKRSIFADPRWLDQNGTSGFFPSAVRVGVDPEVILTNLRKYISITSPNGFIMTVKITGIENCSTVPNTINEMLCMSHLAVGNAHIQGEPETKKKQIEGLPYLLRLFPAWPKDKDARFVNIRTWGAFLVSGELKDGTIKPVRLTSERGRVCHLLNPWPGHKVVVTEVGGTTVATQMQEDRYSFKTVAGKSYEIQKGE